MRYYRLAMLLIFALLWSTCEEAITTVATEIWQATIGDNEGYGTATLSKKSDDSITAEGEWYFYDADTTVSCPFSSGKATVKADSLLFEASGTAYHPGAPVGYQHSPFILKVAGRTNNGHFQGAFEISFTTFGWPAKKTGTVTAVRIEGSGITP